MRVLRSVTLATVATALTLGLAACGGGPSGSDGDAAALENPLRVGASAIPHAEILNYIKENLAEAEGLELDIKVFDDYVQPNLALQDGGLDVNYFQTVPYLEDQQKANSGFADFVPLAPVHIEPLGIYSQSIKDLADVQDGATVAIPNDPTNQGRALKLLESADLITLKDTGANTPTPVDIDENPKNLEITPAQAETVPALLPDVDLGVVNGNNALNNNLTPADDAIFLEPAEDNPNANLVVVREQYKDDPLVQKLEKLLHSPEVKKFIEDTYKGSVIPTF